MTPACDACLRARINPRTSRYTAGCAECQARAVAQAPEFVELVEAEALTPGYRSRLQQIFGSGWIQGHELVKQAAQRIKR